MFSVADRERIQQEIITWAENDTDVIGAALVGSSATGNQDAFSDIDLMLQLAPTADMDAVISRWTERLYNNCEVVHHLDVRAGDGVLYRVFLTKDSMQMDISFWPHDEFRAKGERFRLLFGTPNTPFLPADPDVDAVIGQAWLFAIHIRSALARDTPMYASSLLDTMRIRIMELASIRHGLNPHQRREVDQLPPDYLHRLAQTYPSSIAITDIGIAFSRLMDIYFEEIEQANGDLLNRLRPALHAMMVGRDT